MKLLTNSCATAIAFLALSSLPASADEVNQKTFHLTANPAFVNCLSDGTGNPPSANVTVTRGNLNDTLSISVSHIKPGLSFDLFTVQNSNLLANGQVDPKFANFGMAWYQSDLNVNGNGNGSATIHTILLDQIFGFDAATGLNPVNTFHVGFWFNNPNDAAACGFDPSNPTPFNGEHKAGPVAMISKPNATTNLGPLCTNPNLGTNPASCNP
jgi:hypothetical protein